MRTVFSKVILPALGLLLSFALYAQEGTETSDSEDTLFTDGSDTIVTEGQGVDISSIVSNPIPQLHGSIRVSGGLGFGWGNLEVNQDPWSSFGGFFGYDLGAKLSLDFRPSPIFRWAGNLSASLPAGTFAWSGISIGEMYIEYTLLDSVLFTMGKFGYGWGVGRLLGVNDVLAGIASGLAIKAAIPLGPFTVSPVLMAQPGYFANPVAPSYQELGYAGMIEASLGPLNLGLSGLYQKSSKPRMDLYLKTAALGFDMFSEVLVGFLPTGSVDTKVMAGLFWEGLSPKLRLQLEYLFDGTHPSLIDHSIALAAAISAIPGTSLRLLGHWRHYFIDGSGSLVFGLELDPIPHIHLAIGLPFAYGGVASRAVNAIKSEYINQLGLGVKLDISASF